MELKPIENSSNIAAAGYDAETQTLRVRFSNGSEYDYADVPEALGTGIFEAESAGKFFHGAIRSSFKGARVEKESD